MKKSKKQYKFVNGVPEVVEPVDESAKKVPTKRLKLTKNGTKSIILAIMFAFLMGLMPFFFERAGVYIAQTPQASTIFLKLWHIDSYEGGSGNRASFLERMAREYHEQNSSVYVVVQVMSGQELENAIVSGERPDIISFSHHTAPIFSAYLQELSISTNCRQDLLDNAERDGALYAVPWNLSGYCLVGNSQVDERVLSALSADTAYSFDGGRYNYVAGLVDSYAQVAMQANTDAKADLTRCADILNLTPYQAYTTFVANEASVLLGTARDFYRVKNRVELNNMAECKFVPLGKFSDLVQYLGVLDASNKAVAEGFMEFMVSDDVQKRLCDIGLFSTTGLGIYSDADYKAFEQALNSQLRGISIFASAQQKGELFSSAINALI